MVIWYKSVSIGFTNELEGSNAFSSSVRARLAAILLLYRNSLEL